jgi:hypothetical protein
MFLSSLAVSRVSCLGGTSIGAVRDPIQLANLCLATAWPKWDGWLTALTLTAVSRLPKMLPEIR